jgi:hypothetical protein
VALDGNLFAAMVQAAISLADKRRVAVRMTFK